MSSSGSTSAKPIRWGVLSCGKISHDFVNANIGGADFQFVACAARSLEDAKAFAKQFNIPKYYGSYDELVADSDVEAVYVGSIHTYHSEHSILALKGGKHVLCEKPFAINAKQVSQTLQAAQQSGKFLMEAMWMKYVPSIRHVHSFIQGNASPIGDVKLVEASFGFHMDPNNARLWQNELGGGAVLDLAVYPISLACLVFSQGGKIMPKVTAAGQLTPVANPIDIHESITLDFGPGKLAVLNATFLATTSNEAIITGDKGYIRLCNTHKGSWHCAQRIAIKGEHDEHEKIQEFIEPATQKQLDNKFNFMHSQLLRHEAEHACQCIREDKKESPIHSHQESLLVMKIMDEVRKQLGVVYKEDKA